MAGQPPDPGWQLFCATTGDTSAQHNGLKQILKLLKARPQQP
jgi:hypothetical protein